MSITRMNQIGLENGREEALAYAIVSQVRFKVREAVKNGTWCFDGKPTEVAKTAPKPAPRNIMPPLRTMPARIGKTAKSGGLAASMQRKKAKSAADRELRNKMRSPGKGK